MKRILALFILILSCVTVFTLVAYGNDDESFIERLGETAKSKASFKSGVLLEYDNEGWQKRFLAGFNGKIKGETWRMGIVLDNYFGIDGSSDIYTKGKLKYKFKGVKDFEFGLDLKYEHYWQSVETEEDEWEFNPYMEWQKKPLQLIFGLNRESEETHETHYYFGPGLNLKLFDKHVRINFFSHVYLGLDMLAEDYIENQVKISGDIGGKFNWELKGKHRHYMEREREKIKPSVGLLYRLNEYISPYIEVSREWDMKDGLTEVETELEAGILFTITF